MQNRLRVTCRVAGAALAAAGALSVMAGERKYDLAEHLGQTWRQEFVAYAFAAKTGECAADSLQLRGPQGAVPVQLTEVVLWPGTNFVQAGRVAFIVDELPPLGAVSYTLTFGGAAAPAVPAKDLTATKAEKLAEFATARFGVRVPLGEGTFDKAAAPETVPGPIAALRLADGTWFGGSALYGKTPVKAWRATVVADGPVLARAEVLYTYENGNTLKVVTQLNAGDYAAQISMEVKGESPDDGWALALNNGVTLKEGVKLTGARYLAKEAPLVLNPASTEPACYLNPWPGDGWFQDSPSLLRLKIEGKQTDLQLSIRDCGAWVEPRRDAPWTDFTKWDGAMILQMWHGWQSKRLPLFANQDGVVLKANLMPGLRKWTVGVNADGAGLFEAFKTKATGFWTPLPRLDQVKDMVLVWPDGMRHPGLFGNAQQLADGGKRNADAYTNLRDKKVLLELLANLGALDYMRIIMEISARYDAVVDSGQLTPEERLFVRARMAYLAYQVADPAHWSHERGYCSGNPNMTVSRYANIGIAGLALRDHPLGKEWANYMAGWMTFWLQSIVDDSGSWPESAHYARVSWADFVVFAMAAKQAGLHDFFVDPKFKKMALFYEKTFMPPHSGRWAAGVASSTAVGQYHGTHPRVTAFYGRGTRGDAWGLSGLLAATTASSDPEFSALMQWCWRESGWSEMFSHSTAGATSLLVNRGLPAQAPAWTSEYLPALGYLWRDYVGTAGENYLLWVTAPPRSADGEIWLPDVGSLANWYALGKPIASTFPRAPETCHPVTVNRVALATNWDPAAKQTVRNGGYLTKPVHKAAASLPHLDYADVFFAVTAISDSWLPIHPDFPALPKREVEGTAPFNWERQLLRVSDAQPGGVEYLVLRDTVSGKQPTQWQFYTLTEKIGTPADFADRAAFLKDKPGAAPAPCRELKGDRFTAAGQFGVDLEYYVAAPRDTARHTLRWGAKQGAYGVQRADTDYLDGLLLQLPGDGTYFVAMVPHQAADAAPEFATLADGAVIQITGNWGRDLCFLVPEKREAKGEGARFSGTCASVQNRLTGLALVLGAAGSVDYGDYALTGDGACRLEATPLALTVKRPVAADAASITLRAPGDWKLAGPPAGVTLEKKKGAWQLSLPAGTTAVSLVR